MAHRHTHRPWWKKVPRRPHVEAPHVDARGSLRVVASSHTLGTRIGSVVVIESRKGAVRANHWHRKDSHLCYVLSGSMDYFERPVGSNRKPIRIRVKAGQAVFTPPGVEHAMKFLKPSVFLAIADRHRTQADYERDLVRLDRPLVR